jgi:isoleucyl-tRNA synthetase
MRSNACAGSRTPTGGDLDDDALDHPAEPGGGLQPEIAYGLYEVIGRPRTASATKPGESCAGEPACREVCSKSAKLVEGWTAKLRDVSAATSKGMVPAHPFRGVEGGNGEWDYDVPMLPGDHVTDDAGTGFVHTAPSHGDDDYQLGVKFGLPMTYNVEADGSYRADLPLFGGQAHHHARGQGRPGERRSSSSWPMPARCSPRAS